MLTRCACVTVLLLIAGCTTYGERRVHYPPIAPETHLTVSGQLAYRERIALPPDSAVVIEIGPRGGAALSWLRKIEDGRQQPFAFEIAVERHLLQSDYELRAGIAVAGAPAWSAEPVDIDPGAHALNLGVRTMRRVTD